MKTLFTRLSCSLFVAFCDASMQDPSPLEIVNLRESSLPLRPIITRMSSAATSWQGYLKALYEGHGTYKMYGGHTYNGSIKLGNPNGQGTCTRANGDYYDGQWKYGEQHGEGTYNWPNGDRYEGQWKYGEQHGEGTYNWPNGDHYDGQWENSKMHGQGMIYNLPNRTCYNGLWTKGWPGEFRKNPHLVTWDEKTLPPMQKKTILHALILQSTNDYNGAFGIERGDCQQLSNLLATGGYQTQIKYFGSSEEFAITPKTILEKIDLIWIRAHGSGPEIYCGTNTADETTLQSLIPILNDTCSVVLESCKTGKPGMLAEKFHQTLCDAGKYTTIIAPAGCPSCRGLYLDSFEKGKLKVCMVAIENGIAKDVVTTYSAPNGSPPRQLYVVRT